MGSAMKTILPIAGAAVGFVGSGMNPAGAMAGYQLGSMAGGAIGGGDQGAAPGQAQQVAPGVIQPSGSNMLLSGIPGGDKGAAPQMALPDAPGGDAAKASRMMMALGPMLADADKLKTSALTREAMQAEIQALLHPAPIMPTGSDPGAMGSYGRSTGMSYLGGR